MDVMNVRYFDSLPVTPFMDREKVTKPSSQCSFISLVLLPLFEALASLYPELEVRNNRFWFWSFFLLSNSPYHGYFLITLSDEKVSKYFYKLCKFFMHND